ncbi:MAG: hypothetical protein GXP15_16325 [Gammaproteobacteria bacterium]|nr:hypothetical protein [Gammaproteobacteria bacterium]
MLQVIRDRFTGGFAIAMLALIGVPFMFFGINYNFIGLGYAAKVNGQEISVTAFENAYRNALVQYTDQGIDVPPEFRQVIREGVLDSMIRQALLDQYVADEGFRINDELVTNYIQRATQFQVDGAFSKEAYYQWLELRATEPADFEASQRVGLRLSQLQRGVGSTAFVTPSEYRRYLNLYGERRQVIYAEVGVSALADALEISDEEVQTYYDSRPDAFMAEETVDLSYVEIDRDNLGAEAAITEEELVQFYKDSSSRYMQDERRQARHILILFGEDEAAAETQAAELAARVRAGEPFDSLARQYSKDGGTAQQGGDLGMLLRTQLPGVLGDNIFAMSKGDINGPVRSDFGFHIIRLDDIESGGSLPLEQVRAQLTDELRSRKATDVYDALMGKLSDALFDADEIQDMADAAGLELKTASGFTHAGGEPFGSNQAMIEAVFDERNLDEGFISDIVELDANRSVVFQVTDHSAAARRSLDEVREDIVATIRAERAAAMASEQAAILEAALLRGEQLVDVAEGMTNVNVIVAVISRQDAAIDPAVGAAVFGARKPDAGTPSVGTVVTQTGDYAVYSVTAYTAGRPEEVPLAERDAGKLQLAGQSGAADYAALVAELERRADITKSQDVLAQQSVFE